VQTYRFWIRQVIGVPKHYVSEHIVCAEQSCKSGRAMFWLKFVKMFLADFGHASKFFSQRQKRLPPVTVEAIELIKYSVKMINCELFIHAYFATAPIPCSWAYLDSLVKLANLAFGPKLGFGNKCRARAGLGQVIYGSGRVRASK